jgi:hypothetical protein
MHFLRRYRTVAYLYRCNQVPGIHLFRLPLYGCPVHCKNTVIFTPYPGIPTLLLFYEYKCQRSTNPTFKNQHISPQRSEQKPKFLNNVGYAFVCKICILKITGILVFANFFYFTIIYCKRTFSPIPGPPKAPPLGPPPRPPRPLKSGGPPPPPPRIPKSGRGGPPKSPRPPRQGGMPPPRGVPRPPKGGRSKRIPPNSKRGCCWPGLSKRGGGPLSKRTGSKPPRPPPLPGLSKRDGGGPPNDEVGGGPPPKCGPRDPPPSSGRSSLRSIRFLLPPLPSSPPANGKRQNRQGRKILYGGYKRRNWELKGTTVA